jgi:hypothetical protein
MLIEPSIDKVRLRAELRHLYGVTIKDPVLQYRR